MSNKIPVQMIITELDGVPEHIEVKIHEDKPRYPNDLKLVDYDYTFLQFVNSPSKDEYNDEWYVERNCQYDAYLINGKVVADAVVTFKPIDQDG